MKVANSVPTATRLSPSGGVGQHSKQIVSKEVVFAITQQYEVGIQRLREAINNNENPFSLLDDNEDDDLDAVIIFLIFVFNFF